MHFLSNLTILALISCLSGANGIFWRQELNNSAVGFYRSKLKQTEGFKFFADPVLNKITRAYLANIELPSTRNVPNVVANGTDLSTSKASESARIRNGPIRFNSIKEYSAIVDKLNPLPLSGVLKQMEDLFRDVERNIKPIVCNATVHGKERPACKTCPARARVQSCEEVCDDMEQNCYNHVCEPCPIPSWCPALQPGQKCPAEPKCPDDLCDQIGSFYKYIGLERDKMSASNESDFETDEVADKRVFGLLNISKLLESMQPKELAPLLKIKPSEIVSKNISLNHKDDNDDEMNPNDVMKDDDDHPKSTKRFFGMAREVLEEQNVTKPVVQAANLMPETKEEAKAMLKLQLQSAGFGELTKVPLQVLQVAFAGKMSKLQAILELLNTGAKASQGLTDVLKELMNPTGSLEHELDLQLDLNDIFGSITNVIKDPTCALDFFSILPRCTDGKANLKQYLDTRNGTLKKDNSLASMQFIGDNGRLYSSITVPKMIWALMQHILLDMIRRNCNCSHVCEPIKPARCKCPPTDLQCSIGTNRGSQSRQLLPKARKCRACSTPNICPVPKGCKRNVACPECQDMDLGRHYDDHWLSQGLDDVDRHNEIDGTTEIAYGRYKIEYDLPALCRNKSPIKKPESTPIPKDSAKNKTTTSDKIFKEKHFCKDYEICGRAPKNAISYKTTSNSTQNKKHSSGYIRMGEDTKPGQWPSFAKLEISKNGGVSVCGGVLITRNKVLTAAHCVSKLHESINSSAVMVKLGEYSRFAVEDSEENRSVNHICRAKKYDDGGLKGALFDYAILTLNETVQFDDFIQPACLPTNMTKFKGRGTIKEGSQCYVLGMGITDFVLDPKTNQTEPKFKNKLQMMKVKRVSCNSWGFSNNDRSRYCFTKAAGEGDACSGDSGGPILCLNTFNQWTVMGIVSYGLEVCDGRGAVGWVGVYTRLPALIKTIFKDCPLY